MIWENSIETCILSSVKQITSPGWMHETSAWGWCTGKPQRDRVEREVGGGSGWGIHVNPWLVHVKVWQKPLQYCKVISFQLIKINGKKKVKIEVWRKWPEPQRKSRAIFVKVLYAIKLFYFWKTAFNFWFIFYIKKPYHKGYRLLRHRSFPPDQIHYVILLLFRPITHY